MSHLCPTTLFLYLFSSSSDRSRKIDVWDKPETESIQSREIDVITLAERDKEKEEGGGGRVNNRRYVRGSRGKATIPNHRRCFVSRL